MNQSNCIPPTLYRAPALLLRLMGVLLFWSILPANTRAQAAAKQAGAALPYPIHRAYKVGEANRYHFTVRYAYGDSEFALDASLRMTTLQALPDGSARLRLDLFDGDLSNGDPDQDADLNAILDSYTFGVQAEIVLDKNGRILQSKQIGSGTTDTSKVTDHQAELTAANAELNVRTRAFAQLLFPIVPDGWRNTGDVCELPFFNLTSLHSLWPDTEMYYNTMASVVARVSLEQIEEIDRHNTYRLHYSATWHSPGEGETLWSLEGTANVDRRTGQCIRMTSTISSPGDRSARGTLTLALLPNNIPVPHKRTAGPKKRSRH